MQAGDAHPGLHWPLTLTESRGRRLQPEQWDAIVIGAGQAGPALSVRLAQAVNVGCRPVEPPWAREAGVPYLTTGNFLLQQLRRVLT